MSRKANLRPHYKLIWSPCYIKVPSHLISWWNSIPLSSCSENFSFLSALLLNEKLAPRPGKLDQGVSQLYHVVPKVIPNLKSLKIKARKKYLCKIVLTFINSFFFTNCKNTLNTSFCILAHPIVRSFHLPLQFLLPGKALIKLQYYHEHIFLIQFLVKVFFK